MTVFLQLAAIASLPVILSLILCKIDRDTAFSRIGDRKKQIVIGILFGLLAVCATEFGVKVDGVIINVRDSAPLCAGLIFGGPAGIIAGLIGGIERWFAVYWGAGTYTRLACSISTALAGLIAATLRRFLFNNKRPVWYSGLAIGMIMEVIHMLMIFLFNMSDVYGAFTFVRICSMPMIMVNGIAVMLSLLFVSLLEGTKDKQRGKSKSITLFFQRRLLFCIVVGFIYTSAFSWILQTQLSKTDAENLIRLNINDVKQDILDASDKNLLSITHAVANDIKASGFIDSDRLKQLCAKYNVAEINLIDRRGIIYASTFDSFIHYNMRGGKQSAEFLVLLDGTATEYVQSYQKTTSNAEILRKYAGVALESGGFVQVAYDAERFQRDIDGQVIGATRNRHVGQDGFLIIADENGIIVSDRNSMEGQPLSVTGISLDFEKNSTGERFSAEVYGEPSYCMYDVSEGYFIIAVMPQSEAVFSRDISVLVTAFMLYIVFGTLFVLVFILIKRLIIDNIVRINTSLSEITAGNLDVLADVRTNEEFASLSDGINATVAALKRAIAEEAARIDKELAFAKAIQHSALPSVFPPYPNKTEFDIHATMDTAKEVGGDFYDFYFVGENKLAFLIADVSGKGIPAAMFMMTAKTLLKSYAETGCPVSDVFTYANGKLCENNDAGMFVTAWMGVLDLQTGIVEFANAGHNPPLLRRKNGEFTYLKSRAGFVLAGMEEICYRKNELQLQPGDEIFLYTDGVTEAVDTENQLYGEDRLLSFMNTLPSLSADAVCSAVKADVDRFAGGAPQFDDITMLYLKYNGGTSFEGTTD